MEHQYELKNNDLTKMIDTWVTDHRSAYSFFQHFCAIKLGVIRTPGYRDIRLSEVELEIQNFSEVENIFDKMEDAQICAAYDELEDVRRHLSKVFKCKNIDKLKVIRRIDGIYAQDILFQKEIALQKGSSVVEFQSNTLMSFTGVDLANIDNQDEIIKLNHYKQHAVKITLDIIVDDILFCGSMFPFLNQKSPMMGEYHEYVVVNRHPRGLLNVDINNIAIEVGSNIKPKQMNYKIKMPSPAYWCDPFIVRKNYQFYLEIKNLMKQLKWYHLGCSYKKKINYLVDQYEATCCVV